MRLKKSTMILALAGLGGMVVPTMAHADELDTTTDVDTPLETDAIETLPQQHTTKVIGEFDSTTLIVQIPAVTSFFYNTDTSEMFAQRMSIFNNTNAPVYMNLKQIAVAEESVWQPKLISPKKYTNNEWSNFTKKESKSEVALGLKVEEDEDWLRGIEKNNLWSVDVDNTKIGVIKTKSTIEAEPTLKSGNSISKKEILTTNYIFEFGLE